MHNLLTSQIIFIGSAILCSLYKVESTTTPSESCYLGAYRVKAPPFNSCSGFRSCEAGYFCENGTKFQCPGGSYGSSTGLTSSSCSGLCSAGFYCPPGSSVHTAYTCGGANKYCPEGSSAPLPVPSGYYSVDSNGLDTVDSQHSRSNILICPLGYWCSEGVKYTCPAGTYGSATGLSDASCSGLCPQGFYCPAASENPYKHSCGKSPKKYCPEGSERALVTGKGHYAVISHAFNDGGFSKEIMCPRGSYCIDGVRHDCPGGHYGSTMQQTNASCTGLCVAGYYCPPGSWGSKQNQCYSPAVYCPTGSSQPLNCSVGFYTVGNAEYDSREYNMTAEDGVTFNQAVEVNVLSDGRNVLSEGAHVDQAQCEPGFYCLGDGLKRACPAGRYGAAYGLGSAACSGICASGYYCPKGSVSPQQESCGDADVFCPPGSPEPHNVEEGYYTDLGSDDSNTTRGGERRCEPGFYCQNGVKKLCDAGYWGAEFGQTESTCSGACFPGFYCPAGSISGTEVMCGDPSRYCPGGNPKPLKVPAGYYSSGGNESTRTGVVIAPRGHYARMGLLYTCAAGKYGAIEGLDSAECSGPCEVPGFYCPAGSVSPQMRKCGGDNRYCPPGVVAPIKVHTGFYTADYRLQPCPPGKWRNLTYVKSDFTNISSSGTGMNMLAVDHVLPDCGLCPENTFKSVDGDDFSLCRDCNLRYSVSSDDGVTCRCTQVLGPGLKSYFNVTQGDCVVVPEIEYNYISDDQWQGNLSVTRFKQFPTEVGHYSIDGLRYQCPAGRYGSASQESNPMCTGLCAAGYYCPPASMSPYSHPCGQADLICAEGSPFPVVVPKGYYSNEEAPEELRSYQIVCPVGHYCPGDGKRYKCAKGTYTSKEGTISSECMGVCERGYFCEEGSDDPRQHECGSASVYCPRGSFEPSPVHEGFYGVYTGDDGGALTLFATANTTYSAEIPCEPGWYCTGGIKYPCGPGRFGWRYGMSSYKCGGLCAAGYYCPSYIIPQNLAPPETIYPKKPHVVATDYECGRVEYFCPLGSSYPLIVGGGNYSTGGNTHNRTRTGQAICAPGSYCVNAISILCPPGQYGTTYGLTDKACTGPCPAGFYCPSGTVDPIPCPENTYSIGRAPLCSQCPGARTTPTLCFNEKECCFRG